MDIPEKDMSLTEGQTQALDNVLTDLAKIEELLYVVEKNGVEHSQESLEAVKTMVLELFERLTVSIGYIFVGGDDE